MVYSIWASSTLGALLLITRNGLVSTNFSSSFRLRNCHFFLSCFRSFIFSFSNSIVFLDVFFASLPSFTHPCPPPPSRGNAHLFCFRPFVRLFVRSWLTWKVRAVLWSERICTDLHFSVPGMETLVVILNYRWQVKRLKVPFNSVWRENFVFSAKKTTTTTKKKQ